MKQSDYEKLCEEAFGKPEKFDLLKWLKIHKKLIICIGAVFLLACVALAAFLLREPDFYVHREIPKPVWLQIESRSEDEFIGKDINGKRWLVQGELNALNEQSNRVWVSFEGEPKKPEILFSGIQIDYEVTATSCWSIIETNKVDYGYADSICEFDIDRDGTVEQCILSIHPALSYLTYRLYIWDGDVCEVAVEFNPKCQYLAFYTEGENLKIAGIDRVHTGNGSFSWVEVTYDVIYENGKISLLENGEILALRDAS